MRLKDLPLSPKLGIGVIDGIAFQTNILALNAAVEAARDVSAMLREITAASTEQEAGISQVNTAITEMDGVTQQNASMVVQAARLSQAIGFFRTAEVQSARRLQLH